MPGAGTVNIKGLEPTSNHIHIIEGIDPTWEIYLASVSDAPGVVAANNFLSVFNPVGSGKHIIGLGAVVSTYAVASASSANSMLAYRTTAASGGTQITAANVSRYDTTVANPVAEVRTGNPTVTTSGGALIGFGPPIATGAGGGGVASPAITGATFIMHPGQGLVFATAAGDVNQRWNIQFTWSEYPL